MAIKIPNKPHYAVLIHSSIYIPGDERSRTNPGHGYPEYSVDSIDYKAFDSEDDLTEWINVNGHHKNYDVIYVTPVRVDTTINYRVIKDV